MEPADVLKYLKLMPMFQPLDANGEDDLFRLVPYVEEFTYKAGDILYAMDEIPNRTTLIIEGTVSLSTVDDNDMVKELGRCGAGEVIGRRSLKPGDFEYVSARAADDVRVLELPFRDLVRAYQNSHMLRQQLDGTLAPRSLVSTLKKIPLFETCDDETGELELYHLVPVVHEQLYGDREWLFRQGEIADRLIYVLEGQIRLDLVKPDGTSRQVGTLIPGDVTGETGLLVGDYHDVTATAEGYARVLFILREDFTGHMMQRTGLRQRLNVSENVQTRQYLRDFDWLRSDEWVVKIIQRHWTMLVRTIAAPIVALMGLVPLAIAMFSSQNPGTTILGWIAMLPTLAAFGLIVYQFVNWRDDFFVITTQRVLHTERVWPFSTKDEETTLDNIEDIHNIRTGIAANLLDYGNLVLQTAGETVQIDMHYIPHPDEAREIISEQIERFQARELLQAQGHIRDMLQQRLYEPDELPPAAEEKAGADKKSKNVLTIIFSALWYYLFPPAWTETGNGATIVWRRYWLPGFWRNIAAFIPLTALTIGGGTYLLTHIDTPNILGIFIAWALLEAIIAVTLLWLIEDWRNDYFQMTWNHIIQVDRRPLFLQESRREARLDRIQNLSFEVPGMIARLFKYGHVTFETAGTEGKFEMRYVRHPAKVKAAISDRQYQYNQRMRQMGAKQRQQELLNWFTIYDEFQRGSNVRPR